MNKHGYMIVAGTKVKRKRRGLTLAELTVAMSVMTVVFGGISSALVIASHALPGRKQPADAMVRASRWAEQIASELHCATAARERTPNSITFTVPDRDRDGAGEIIRYAWSSTPGTSITRQYNDAPADDIITDAYDFALGYQLVTERRTEEGDPVQSPLQKLIEFDTNYNLKSHTLNTSRCIGQTLRPLLPNDTVSWSIDYVYVAMASGSYFSGDKTIQLQLADANGLPTGVVLEQVVIGPYALSSTYSWIRAVFHNASALQLTDKVCVVVKQTTSATWAYILYTDQNPHPTLGNLVKSTNGGASWTSQPSDSLELYVFGTITRAGDATEKEVQLLNQVDISLRVGDAGFAQVDTAVQILNKPEVSEP